MEYSSSTTRFSKSNAGIIDISTWDYLGDKGNHSIETTARIYKIVAQDPMITKDIFIGTIEELISRLTYRQPIVNAPYLPKYDSVKEVK